MEYLYDLAQKDDLSAKDRVRINLGPQMRAWKDVVAEVCTKFDLGIDL